MRSPTAVFVGLFVLFILTFFVLLSFFSVPSKAPSNIAAQNHTSLTRIPISWEPVPREFLHGFLAGYRVTYKAVYVGDLPVDSETVISRDVGPAITYLTLQNLVPLAVYRITVAARTNKGPGPRGVTFGGKVLKRVGIIATTFENTQIHFNSDVFAAIAVVVSKAS